MFSDVLKKVVTSSKNMEYITKMIKKKYGITCEIFDMDLNIIVMEEADNIGTFLSSKNTNAIKELKKINNEIINRLLPKLRANKKANDMYLKQLGTRPWENPMALPVHTSIKEEVENIPVVDLSYEVKIPDNTLIYKEQLGDRDARARF